MKTLLSWACLAGFGALLPVAAQTTTGHASAAANHTATRHAATHHAVHHPCAVPEPALSPKIPPAPAHLGCPKIAYALTYLDLKVGTGELAQPRMYYTVQYTGYLTDGTKFDSSYDHGQPFTFRMARTG